MGFERNYQIKIPSKQLKIRKSSTFNYYSHINSWVWTGLIDAFRFPKGRGGSFTIIVTKSKSHKSGWKIEPKFQMGLDKRDLPLLLQFQQSLKRIGSIYESSTLNKVNYIIYSKEDLAKLIIFLDKYPLLTQKAADFILFREVVKLMMNKAHLSIEGLNKVVNIKASMNLGLSDNLKSEFNDFTPHQRPEITTDNISFPNWFAGFVTGEGNFDVKIYQRRPASRL
jgi:hypothetical protein